MIKVAVKSDMHIHTFPMLMCSIVTKDLIILATGKNTEYDTRMIGTVISRGTS